MHSEKMHNSIRQMEKFDSAAMAPLRRTLRDWGHRLSTALALLCCLLSPTVSLLADAVTGTATSCPMEVRGGKPCACHRPTSGARTWSAVPGCSTGCATLPGPIAAAVHAPAHGETCSMPALSARVAMQPQHAIVSSAYPAHLFQRPPPQSQL